MSFQVLALKPEYRSPQDNVVKDVFIPALKLARCYKRAVGFFSSTSLAEITKGISGLVENGGTIQIVASPALSESDEQAIKLGYEKRKTVIEKKLLGELEKEESDYFKQERLNLLANLIANNILDLKIAFTDTGREAGIYHEKLGIFEDLEGNKIAFDGSMNESVTAMRYNYESVNVYCSWKSEDVERATSKVNAFEKIWNNTDTSLNVVDFPSVTQKILDKYKRKDFDLQNIIKKANEIDIQELEKKDKLYNNLSDNGLLIREPMKLCNSENKLFFNFFDGKTPRDYQLAAILKFKENNYKCLFAMATGTGKTLTSLFAVNELCLDKDIKCILILVPLKDLVEQWNKDVSKYFNGNIILVHSGNNWKEKVTSFTIKRLINSTLDEKIILISTYDSFSLNKDKILKLLDLSKTVIIADECHKTGAYTYRKNLPSEILFRIGLSATPKRPFDLKGTQAIFDYFDPNENPYEFTIEMAIDRHMLCPYNYHPIFVELTINEMEDYAEITERINKLIILVNSDMATEEDEDKLEQMLKQRHRIIERAENKFDLFAECFLEELKKYTQYTIVFAPDGTDENNNNILLKYKDFVTKKAKDQNIFLTSVDYVQGTDKKMLEYFGKGQIDVVFAKQRLNEGIDIPAARRAFFVASSTSEREFIQRRGRVLRLCEGKDEADIFDFIVVAPAGADTYFDKKLCDQIKESELKRALDFAKTAKNFSQLSDKLVNYM